MLKSRLSALPPWTMAVTAMLCVQLGSALSIDMIETIGPAGTAWLRLSFGALILFAIARPSVRGLSRGDLPVLIGLGAVTGLMSIAFLAAIELIPLGTSVAIEFLGPLTVAALGAHSKKALLWPALALVGVIGLTQPWLGEINLAGVAYAAFAGVCWGLYIVLTQRVGDRFAGISGLALTMPIAALTAAVVGVPQAAGHLSAELLLIALGLALLLPVIPFALEMLALQRMTHTAFGTLMALEPAIGVVLGLIVLQQTMSPVQIVGVLLVVIAGAGAQRGGRRPEPHVPDSDEIPLDLVG